MAEARAIAWFKEENLALRELVGQREKQIEKLQPVRQPVSGMKREIRELVLSLNQARKDLVAAQNSLVSAQREREEIAEMPELEGAAELQLMLEERDLEIARLKVAIENVQSGVPMTSLIHLNPSQQPDDLSEVASTLPDHVSDVDNDESENWDGSSVGTAMVTIQRR
eukprot:CAMPEP_0204259618 /NCGR_PEP_ID=MMETSP0468-20130131/5763_1 /ASSEMBLY_ACC=CAM_ASM_000383 /TAXON_ID=2969 /ORGANISM="Oxyrrhis marina" /LENGTH=167 /DNA_ID=CAMNT_0051233929 /DNA_START=29 /DNA_END=532 /DNA_ORIENTATION=-